MAQMDRTHSMTSMPRDSHRRMLKNNDNNSERQSGTTEIQGLSAGPNCMTTTTLSKEKKERKGIGRVLSAGGRE